MLLGGLGWRISTGRHNSDKQASANGMKAFKEMVEKPTVPGKACLAFEQCLKKEQREGKDTAF